MIYKAGKISWLVETPSGRAGFSVRDEQVFLHYEHNPHDPRIPLEVARHSQKFFDMVRERTGAEVAYSVVSAADVRLNKFQKMAGMDFLKTFTDKGKTVNIYWRQL